MVLFHSDLMSQPTTASSCAESLSKSYLYLIRRAARPKSVALKSESSSRANGYSVTSNYCQASRLEQTLFQENGGGLLSLPGKMLLPP